MAVIAINNFVGLRPSQSARAPSTAMPAPFAQVAHNILPRTAEFWPLANDVTVVQATGISNPKTLYRLARTAGGAFNSDTTQGWKVWADWMNPVKAQVNNDTTERTYLTYGDGSQRPRVFDATGADRLLGVPAPESAPVVVVNVVDEFTTEERPAAVGQLGAQVEAAIRSNLAPAWIGDRDPGAGTPGYLKRAGLFTTDELGALQARLYRIASSGGANNGALSDSYTSLDIGDFTWVADPALGGTFYSTPAQAAPGWMGPVGQDHRVILFHAYGLGYTFNRSAAEVAMAAVVTPGDDPQPLLDAGQINAICDTVEDYLDGNAAAGVLEPLRAKALQIRSLLDGDSRASTIATTAAYYDRADIQAEFDTAIANFATTVFNTAFAIVRSAPAIDPSSNGGGD